jgi:hypothetical protein
VDETPSDGAYPVVVAAGVLSVVAAGVHAVGSWVPTLPDVLGCTAVISGEQLLALNGGMIAALLLFGYVSVFHARELLTTRLGRGLVACIIAFWLLRAAMEFFLVDPTRVGFLVIPACLGMAALYLVPILWSDVAPAWRGSSAGGGQHPGTPGR